MERSAKFDRVKGYYDAGLWNEKMVRDAVDRWITAEEGELILSARSALEGPTAAAQIENLRRGTVADEILAGGADE